MNEGLYSATSSMAMAPLGANLLVWSVESRSPSPQSCGMPEPDTVVVLSGGTDRQPRSPGDFAALDASSLQRLLAGIALWERIPDARLVIAGDGQVSLGQVGFMAIGAAVSFFILEWVGFDSNLAVQSENTIFTIRLLLAAIPIVGLIIAMIALARFPLSQERMAEIRAQLEARRGKV